MGVGGGVWVGGGGGPGGCVDAIKGTACPNSTALDRDVHQHQQKGTQQLKVFYRLQSQLQEYFWFKPQDSSNNCCFHLRHVNKPSNI